MKLSKSREVKFFGHWVSFGYFFPRFAFGFSLDRYSFQVDFLIFWFGIEFK
jgi:hypothetical protein